MPRISKQPSLPVPSQLHGGITALGQPNSRCCRSSCIVEFSPVEHQKSDISDAILLRWNFHTGLQSVKLGTVCLVRRHKDAATSSSFAWVGYGHELMIDASCIKSSMAASRWPCSDGLCQPTKPSSICRSPLYQTETDVLAQLEILSEG